MSNLKMSDFQTKPRIFPDSFYHKVAAPREQQFRHRDNVIYFWYKAIDCIKQKEWFNAVKCCNEGYRSSAPPIIKLKKIELFKHTSNTLFKLIKKILDFKSGKLEVFPQILTLLAEAKNESLVFIMIAILIELYYEHKKEGLINHDTDLPGFGNLAENYIEILKTETNLHFICLRVLYKCSQYGFKQMKWTQEEAENFLILSILRGDKSSAVYYHKLLEDQHLEIMSKIGGDNNYKITKEQAEIIKKLYLLKSLIDFETPALKLVEELNSQLDSESESESDFESDPESEFNININMNIV